MPAIPRIPVSWRFPAHPSSVRLARQAVSETLPYALLPDLRDGIGLLTSELVTNAVRHGAGAEDGDLVELVLWPADGHYWLAVSDPGTGGGRTPVVRRPGTGCESGRGLLLVDQVAAAWAVRPGVVRGTCVVAGVSLGREA
ncbi:ATP-binding protein [Streptomyces montanisoli]|uniref:ATP-binding protein n=1 Tax=Streptomyces montanisoli TaxID=2798581 RepID=A0A940RZN8_9ACTN|nr:ATP-binding protein [Streptomyces montanisoli]MBP0460448.1 ATP-binding protein [Streptomyces montanisoli]